MIRFWPNHLLSIGPGQERMSSNPVAPDALRDGSSRNIWGRTRLNSSRCWVDCDQVLVGGRGHYLNSQNELAGSVLNLIRNNRERLDTPFAGRSPTQRRGGYADAKEVPVPHLVEVFDRALRRDFKVRLSALDSATAQPPDRQ